MSVVGNCLDGERTSLRRLVVMASSAGYSDLAAVFVHIKYSVDQSPLFSIDRCEALVAEGAPPGTVVARLPPVYYPGQCDVHMQQFFSLFFYSLVF